MTPQRQARRRDDRHTGRSPRWDGRRGGGQPCKMSGPRLADTPDPARCNTEDMRKRLPDAVRALDAVPKLIWCYVDRWPGEHSVQSLKRDLGVEAGRALPALVAAGLLIEEEAPTRRTAGKYRAVTTPQPQPQPRPAPAPEREEGQTA